MNKAKGLGITTKQILEAARAKALSYVVSPRKRKKMTPKQKKAQAIYEAAKEVGGCQEEPLMKLMDLITGLPVSSEATRPSSEGEYNDMTDVWCQENPMRMMYGTAGCEVFLILGFATITLWWRSGTEFRMGSTGGPFRIATEKEINSFFDAIPVHWASVMGAIYIK